MFTTDDIQLVIKELEERKTETFFEYFENACVTKNKTLFKDIGKINESITSRDFINLRNILNKYEDTQLQIIKSVTGEKIDYLPIDEQVKLAQEKWPSLVIKQGLSEKVLTIIVDLNLINRDFAASDFWQLKFPATEISITFSGMSITKVSSPKTNHPYFQFGVATTPYLSDAIPMSTTPIFKLIEEIVNRFSTYRGDWLRTTVSHLIGSKCDVCKAYTYSDEIVRCPKTDNIIHKSCGVEFEGYYYTPKYIKECCKCKKQSLNWIANPDKTFTCGDCLNDV